VRILAGSSTIGARVGVGLCQDPLKSVDKFTVDRNGCVAMSGPRSLEWVASPHWLTPGLLRIPTKSSRRYSVAVHESIDLALAGKGLLLLEYSDTSSSNVMLLLRKKRSWRLLQSIKLRGHPSPSSLIASFDTQNRYDLLKVLQGRLPLRCVAPEVHSVADLEGDGSWLTTLCFGATGYDYSLVSLEYVRSMPPTPFVVVAPQPGLLEVLLAGCGLRPREPVALDTSMHALPAAQALKQVVTVLKEGYLDEINSLYRGDGPESVHQARTSLRRLALLARLSSTKPETKSVSQVFHALGDIRNLDIVVAWMRENSVDQSRIDQALELRTTKFNLFQERYPLRSHRRLFSMVSMGPLESDLTLDSWATHSRAQLTSELVTIDLSRPSFATIHRFRRRLRQYSDFVQIFPEYRLADIVMKQTLSKLGQLSDLSTIRAYMRKTWPEFAELGERRNLAKSDIVPELIRLRSQIIDSTS